MIRIFLQSEETLSQSLLSAFKRSGEFELVTDEHAADVVLIVKNKSPGAPAGANSFPLTAREMEILRLIADGEGNKSIAYLLQISEHTVKFHISSIFQKLHVFSRTEAIKVGIQQGLISI